MIGNTEPGAETHPYVSKGMCRYFDWEGDHRNKYIKVAYSVKEMYLKWRSGELGSRKNYTMNTCISWNLLFHE